MTKVSEVDITFMRKLEDDYKTRMGLKDRSQYKIFYGPVRSAKILVLGINPGGDPATRAPDGVRYLDGSGRIGAASAFYHENDEHDLVDCDWPENAGLLKLLLPLLGSRESIRRQVVKCNMAFRRSVDAKKKAFIENGKREAKPFLSKIIERVEPELIILAGVNLMDFTDRYAQTVNIVSERQVDSRVNQTIFWAGKAVLNSSLNSIVVSVASASQFSWIYSKYDVPDRIRSLWRS